ncbi:hypothetical protein FB451DRAFT_1491928 [Mycena latifolia]|nr:hypothetical protein FB451DRAFT_1491928 [Mycena latifolia]
MVDRGYALKEVSIFHLFFSARLFMKREAEWKRVELFLHLLAYEEESQDKSSSTRKPAFDLALPADFAAALQQAQDKVDEDCQKTYKFERFGLAHGAGVYEFVTLNPWVPQVHALVPGACVADDTQCRRTTTHAGGRVLRTHPRFVLRANLHGVRVNSFVFVPLVFFQRELKGVLGCRHNEESRRVDRASAPSGIEPASLISNVEDAFQLDECKPSLQ